eukprot:m.273351 g.273351  ORF g.273351 m.273351 type:complete len:422 (-) comp106296_c0_seq1:115-1380(-)
MRSQRSLRVNSYSSSHSQRKVTDTCSMMLQSKRVGYVAIAMIATILTTTMAQTTFVATTMNSTNDDDDRCKGTKVIGYMSAVVIFFISLSLGTTVTQENVSEVAYTKKKALIIGWACQFGLMPLITFAFASIFGYSDAMAIGCILCGAAPGGSTSNLATFFSKGDTTLSIIMSTASTICAFFMVPIAIALYIDTTFNTTGVSIDWFTLFISLLVIIVPVALGALLKRKNTTMKIKGKFLWELLQSFGSIVGAVLLGILILWGVLGFSDVFDQDESVWIPAYLLQPIGYAFGYGMSTIFGLDRPARRAVSLETGIQNYSFAIAVVTISFQGESCDTLFEGLAFPYIATTGYLFNLLWYVPYLRYIHAPNDPQPDTAKEKTAEIADVSNQYLRDDKEEQHSSVVDTRTPSYKQAQPQTLITQV